MQSEAYGVSSIERKKIERLFGEAKHILSMVRLRLRGLTGADRFIGKRGDHKPACRRLCQ